MQIVEIESILFSFGVYIFPFILLMLPWVVSNTFLLNSRIIIKVYPKKPKKNKLYTITNIDFII